MIITNDINNVDLKEINGFSCTENGQGKPCISLELNNNKVVQMVLSDAFSIHKCNEFLRSLNVINEEFICFRGFDGGFGYIRLIDFCNKLFEIRKIMEAVTSKEYSQIGVIAYDVNSCILDKVMTKHGFKTLDAALQNNPLDWYVTKALTYFK